MDPENTQAEPTPQEGATAAPAPAQEAAAPARVYTAAEYREVQNEAKNLRARLKASEEAASSATPALEAARAEAETLRSEVATLRDEVRSYRLRDAIAETARADDADDLRGLDPDLAARLIDGVEYGDDGRPKALGPRLRALVKKYPQLAAAPRVPAQPSAGRSAARTQPDEAEIQREKRRVAAVI